MPHCHWTVEIDPAFEPVVAHPNVAIVESALVAGIPVRTPEGDAEPGGWDDYDRDFDPDFQLEDLSHRALVVALQEFAVQSHLLFRAFLLAVAQQLRRRRGRDASTRRSSPGSPGSPRSGSGPRWPSTATTPPRSPRSCSSTRCSSPGPTSTSRSRSLDDDRVRFAIPDSPRASPRATTATWFAQLGGAGDRALDAIVRAVNPRARVEPTGAACRVERFAYEAVIDRDATPAAEAPEIGLAKISTGATVEFSPPAGPCARSSNLSTLPLALSGSASTTSTRRGTL